MVLVGRCIRRTADHFLHDPLAAPGARVPHIERLRHGGQRCDRQHAPAAPRTPTRFAAGVMSLYSLVAVGLSPFGSYKPALSPSTSAPRWRWLLVGLCVWDSRSSR